MEMKRNRKILPGLAAGNIRKNASAYLPYMAASVFAMFTYFVFDLVLKNPVIYTLPKGAYAVMLIRIGFWLLGFIMVPFLYYTNRFLIKRRKRELGLYSILGMEKKHIGAMLFWESLILYAVVMAAAVILGLAFFRLVFLLLLNLTGLPVETDFAVSPAAVRDAFLFYGIVTCLNLAVNLVQVGKANPVELMQESRSGERQPKLLPLWGLLGALTLGRGYYLALTMHFNIRIFDNFFLAVGLVVMGTYFLFTSGSILLLRFLKNRTGFYYRPENFVPVSGMLYRMKKNAAGLSNLCVFSTMVIITVICTLAVALGMDSIKEHMYDREIEIEFAGKDTVDRSFVRELMDGLAEQYQVQIGGYADFAYIQADSYVKDGHFYHEREYAGDNRYMDMYEVDLTTLEEYNLLEGQDQTLKKDQILVYSTGRPLGWQEIAFGDRVYLVKEEVDRCGFWEKAPENGLDPVYVVVAPDQEAAAWMAEALGKDAREDWRYHCGFDPVGEEEAVDRFSAELYQRLSGFLSYADHRQSISELSASYGGLLFVGIFFGLIFLICLVVIMYYKQIAEGLEDRSHFEVMQKVGMNDREIRRTINRQVRMVFFLPLFGALLHTAVGMRLVYILLGVIGFYEQTLAVCCTAGVCLMFTLVYYLCYRRTSQAYYRIVK